MTSTRWLTTLTTTLLFGLPGSAETVPVLTPTPWQVIQRQGFVPHRASANEPGGPILGFADVPVRLKIPSSEWTLLEYRVISAEKAVFDWTAADFSKENGNLSCVIRVPAGGWYRVEFRFRKESLDVATASVFPIGVGEVFLIAGQSYATNCNDEILKVNDPAGRVAAGAFTSKQWRTAHDPQPVVDGSTGGSIWPAFGDLLVSGTRVPVGFVNVAVGGTSSEQWLPGTPLHNRLVEAGKELRRFRAVLWQQGESDVIAKTSTQRYVNNVQSIRDAAVKAWGFTPPWFAAKSTLHPTVYTDPDGEARIRQGIDALCKLPHFLPGPDTDILSGENRGGAATRRHFSGVGQRNAAALWFAVVWNFLNRTRPDHEALLGRLRDFHLGEPSWSSPIVRRESSVLLRSGDGTVTARLAFPASEILEVRSADGKHRWNLTDSMRLSSDGLTLSFSKPDPLPVIDAEKLFVPKGSPDSYSMRVGHPEQSLIFHPGRWFHDRNLEITYRRREASRFDLPRMGSLPQTIARLKSGRPLKLAVSGDSISTGADASAVSRTAPYQPGFPELVAAQLQADTDCEIELVNRAVGGWSVADGVKDQGALLASKPDLIIFAYGMNDVGRRDPKWFGAQAQTFLDRVRKECPNTEVILVAPMLGHREWHATPREMFALYRDRLRELTGEGVTLADVTAVWTEMIANKHDLDYTGNGLNHPNDFGHRLYAQVILRCLLEPRSKVPTK